MYILELQDRVKELFSQAGQSNVCASPLIESVRVDLKRLNLSHNLALHAIFPKAYWCSRDNEFEAIALGSVLSITSALRKKYEFINQDLIPVLKRSAPLVRFYGGVSFAEGQNASLEWEPFGAYLFFIPRFEIVREGHNCSLVVNCRLDLGEMDLKRCLIELDTLQLDFGAEQEAELCYSFDGKRTDFPEKVSWIEKVESVLKEFSPKGLRKIVLARRSHFAGGESSTELFCNPVLLMQRLLKKTDNCFHFFISTSPEAAFMGASPELLYRRMGEDFFTEALAGTRPRGVDEKDSQNLSFDLLNSEKEFREHAMVQEVIERSLNDLCRSWDNTASRKIVKVSQSQHLRSSFAGKLKPEATDALVLDSLHPTPAVGAYPREGFMDILGRYEQFSRGWYAGPIGWLSAQCAEFSVALRCGLLNSKSLYLYAGAGIVQGSIPEQEWLETENKLGSFMRAFY